MLVVDIPFHVVRDVIFDLLTLGNELAHGGRRNLNDRGVNQGDAVGKGWKRAVFNIILGLALIFACIGSGKSIKSNVIDKLAPPKAPAAETVPAPAVPETPALDAPAAEEQEAPEAAAPEETAAPAEEASVESEN